MSNWKDDCREHKEETGLSWAEYHERYFVHRHQLDDLHTQIETLTEHVEANKNTYQKMQRELHEVRALVNHE